MAKSVRCNVYATNLQYTYPNTVPTNLTLIENRIMFFPEILADFASSTTEIVTRSGIQTAAFEQMEAAIPEWYLISTFYNWSSDPSSEIYFEWFPELHNYYPNYLDVELLFEFFNSDGTIYGYILSDGGNSTNPRTALYNGAGNKIVECANLLAGNHGILIKTTSGAISDISACKVDGVRNVRVRVIPTSSFTVGSKQLVLDFLNGIPFVEPSTDPYDPGGESGTGGGEGTFDGTSVDVDFTSLPTLSAVDTGFITLYNPTLSQLQSLANYMWSDLFDLDTLKKLFADPMQAILGLSIIPGPIPSGASQAVKVGNIATTVTMTKAASQYFDVDCGTLNVEEFWGAYLDYEPYTKAEIYLPYIGTHQIAVDDIMGKAVHIKYHVDILSGACSAEIKCGGSVLYTFIGSVAVSVPVTGNDWTNVINGVLSIAGSIGSMVATGGLSAPSAIGSIASAAVNQLKPSIQKSGSVSGGGGILAGKVPVLILTRPRQALPASQNEFTGYPAFITRSLGDISGYTEVHKIRLGGISATDAELEEIEGLLKGGVIL